MVVGLIGLGLLTACSSSDDIQAGEADVPTVKARYSFALPKRIVGKQSAKTRMDGDVVQEDATSETFRGIGDIRLMCFSETPQKNSQKLGSIIELNTKKSTELDNTAEQDFSATQEIRIPVGTNHFAFYAHAADDRAMTHEDKMKYGVIERVGVGKNDYTGNQDIRFRPVPICTTAEPLGGSAKGQALLNLLNELVAVTVNDVPEPNDKWATANNLYLNEAYQQLTALQTLSSFNVQVMLGKLKKLISQEAVDAQGKELVAAIKAKILSYCEEQETGADPDVLTLKADYQGFPDDIHLPAGVARVKWDSQQQQFVVPAPNDFDYGKQLAVPSQTDFCYPMNLQYQIFSDIVASDSLVDLEEVAQETATIPGQGQGSDPQQGSEGDEGQTSAKTWKDLLDTAYEDESKSDKVKETTQSVAMIKQVEYAVGRLALRARINTGNIYDAKGKRVDVSNGFTLKGYIVGGQREVDYNFQTVEGSKSYAIYDTDLAGAATTGAQHLRQGSGEGFWTQPNYILGLGTPRNEPVYLAMELVNDSEDFWGADGLIVHGATFYLVAALNPADGTNYSTGSLDQIFSKDTATQVALSVMNGWQDKDGDGVPDPDLDTKTGQPKPLNGLATATYGMPSVEIPHPTVGLSVNLNWGEGLYFDEVPL